MRGKLVLLVAAWLLGIPGFTARATEPTSSVVFIEVGYMENGVFQSVGEGTGFIVHPAGWVVTAKHVSDAEIPAGKIRFIRGAVKSRTAAPNQLFDVATPSVSADIALLRFSPNLKSDWPFLKVRANHVFKLLDDVTAYGFPEKKDIEVRPGVVSNLAGPRGSMGVNVGLAPGMSGGPVLLGSGRCVIGVVAGGSGYPNFDYFMPLQFAKPLLEVPPAEFVTVVTASTDGGGAVQAPIFERPYAVDETFDEHREGKSSKTYSIDFQADPGSKITAARLAEASAAAVFDKVLNIQGDRSKVTFKFRLESGPFYDRWRGWWHGQVVLTQQRDTPQASTATCE
ncbi:serine protease [Bradyrhizobium ontarionense]|uniref:Serine protease n=1 Tax=Bradyrhizobium ontarionense TaxID=2898149 RepID=A0ABY3RHP6_9BRAD|nr:serine protease [Bradyrhizobium sp. A19]UFZ06356.1 serine protease [Bradyrhizobium sp. A19]